MKVSAKEVATILAALRDWQRWHLGQAGEDAIATNDGEFDPLDDVEIDDLCQRLNCGD
jgi:hypothetical protein